MSAGHTPGPWFGLDSCTSSGLSIRGGSHHYPIAKMCSYWDGPGPREAETKANYALMVAAPGLLGQLDSAQVDLDLLRRAIKEGARKAELLIRVTDLWRRNQEAIAKAKGEA